MMRPNLYNYRATDVAPAAMNEMFEIGYEEAKSRMAELKKAIEDAKSKLR